MSKEEIKEEIKEEVKEEVKEEACDCGCEHEGCDCGCEECFDDCSFEPIHKRFTHANIFAFISKIIGILFFIIGTYSYCKSILSYNEMYGELPNIIEIAYGFLSSILLISFAFWAIGEVINLINRIKESLLY